MNTDGENTLRVPLTGALVDEKLDTSKLCSDCRKLMSLWAASDRVWPAGQVK